MSVWVHIKLQDRDGAFVSSGVKAQLAVKLFGHQSGKEESKAHALLGGLGGSEGFTEVLDLLFVDTAALVLNDELVLAAGLLEGEGDGA